MINKLRELYCKQKKNRELRKMQEMLWSSCFESFPPWYYPKHTYEEITKCRKEEIVKLRKLLKDYKQKNLKE